MTEDPTPAQIRAAWLVLIVALFGIGALLWALWQSLEGVA